MGTQEGQDSGMKPPLDDDVAPHGYIVYHEHAGGARGMIFCVTPTQVRKLLAENPGWKWEYREDPMETMKRRGYRPSSE